MDLTTLGLKKPLVTEAYDLQIVNDNADKVNELITADRAQINNLAAQLNNFPIILPEIDDTARIQRALNAVSNTVKTVVFEDNKTYIISNSLLIKNNTNIILGRNTIIKVAASSTDLCIFTNEDTVNGNKNITIDGGILDGNIANQNAGALIAAIVMKNCSNLIIKNVEVKNCSAPNITALFKEAAILLLACKDCILSNVIAHDNKKCGIQISGEIANNPIGFKANTFVENCTFYNNGVSGIDTSAGANYVTIRNCIAYNNARIVLDSAQITINAAYNFIYNCISYCDESSVGNHYNVGHSSIELGIGAQAPHSKISNCHCHGSCKYGLYIHSSDYVTVNDFNFYSDGSDTSGILVENAKYFNITKVAIFNGGNAEQINLKTSNNGVITDSELYNGKRGGLRLDDGCANIKILSLSVTDNNSSNNETSYSAACVINICENIIVRNSNFINQTTQNCKMGFYINPEAKNISVLENVVNNIYKLFNPTRKGIGIGINYHNGIAVDGNNIHIVNDSKVNKIMFSDTIPPIQGSFEKGDLIINSAAMPGESLFVFCQYAGTLGTLSGITGNIIMNTNILIVNSIGTMKVGDFITVADSGRTYYKIVQIDGLNVYLDQTAVTSVSGAIIGFRTPTLSSQLTIV